MLQEANSHRAPSGRCRSGQRSAVDRCSPTRRPLDVGGSRPRRSDDADETPGAALGIRIARNGDTPPSTASRVGFNTRGSGRRPRGTGHPGQSSPGAPCQPNGHQSTRSSVTAIRQVPTGTGPRSVPRGKVDSSGPRPRSRTAVAPASRGRRSAVSAHGHLFMSVVNPGRMADQSPLAPLAGPGWCPNPRPDGEG